MDPAACAAATAVEKRLNRALASQRVVVAQQLADLRAQLVALGAEVAKLRAPVNPASAIDGDGGVSALSRRSRRARGRGCGHRWQCSDLGHQVAPTGISARCGMAACAVLARELGIGGITRLRCHQQ